MQAHRSERGYSERGLGVVDTLQCGPETLPSKTRQAPREQNGAVPQKSQSPETPENPKAGRVRGLWGSALNTV